LIIFPKQDVIKKQTRLNSTLHKCKNTRIRKEAELMLTLTPAMGGE